MRKVLTFEFVRFLLVGTLNTAFSYGVYALLLFIGWPYVAANLGAVLLGILFSFTTQGRLVFGNREGHLLQRFAACWALIWAVNALLITLLVHAGLSAYAAGAVALVPTTVVSYFVQKLLVFGGPRGPRASSTAKSSG